MAGGSKKKKKPASNPARAVATTSIQAKSKVDVVKEEDTASAVNTATPSYTSDLGTPAAEAQNGTKQSTDRGLHELSPEELEAQLERSELQLFVEAHAARTRKDAARQVSRLQTDKRLLRGQADYLAVKDWLPEEIMLQILDFTNVDRDHENYVIKPQNLASGDDLLARIWNLSLCLHDLDVHPERVHEVIVWLLQNPPPEDPGSQAWGLTEAFDWLALHSDEGDLIEYDTQRRINVTTTTEDIDDPAPALKDEEKGVAASLHPKTETTISSTNGLGTHSSSDGEDFEVSDVGSDAEPDELLSAYLRTRERLYRLDPAAGENSKRGKGRTKQPPVTAAATPGTRKLQEKLRKIENDALFDNQEADMRWESKRIDLARDIAERKKLHLPENSSEERTHKTAKTPNSVTESNEIVAEESTSDNDGADDILGGMFDALPGISKAEGNNLGDGDSTIDNLIVKDFGKMAGMSPRRILEETCRARDPGCRVRFEQISRTTYNCRHAVEIQWVKAQETSDVSFIPSLTIKSKPKTLQVAMKSIAMTEAAQSEAYVATAALFVLFSSSPKEEKARLRLPPIFRDLWDEFLEAKREHDDDVDRETVKGLRKLIDEHMATESDIDDEVVFKAGDRFRSGISTPVTRPDTPERGSLDSSVALQEMWNQKVNSESYQRMLIARMNLPMFHAKAEAMEVIETHQVTIIVGDTGSGKSTQLPQFLLERALSRGQSCKIYCTEPRRISAISLAYRVSEELGESKRDFGTPRSTVGYAVRLDSKVGPSTRLVYATVGIVLRMLENEDGLQEITHLCLDEIHERSIDSDFLLIVLRSLMLKRPDLKVILMSATVDAQKFSQYLDGAPIVSVPGRTFPVEARFLEDAIELTGHTNEDAAGTVGSENDDVDETDQQDKTGKSQLLANYSKRTITTLSNYDEYRIDHNLIVKLLEAVAYHQDYHRFSKAILVFLPGIAEIRQLNDMLGGHPSFLQGWRIHALHSTFSSDEQQAAFDIPPPGIRKIVLATNIAETGITIPDVTCVVDTGKHREMRFDERRQMSRLIQSFIARANAKQRRGRAGRVQEGICFHLFTRYRFENLMIDQQTPEMLRLSLQDLVMRVKICKLGDIEQTLTAALDPPSTKNIRRAIDALIEVDALTPKELLTPLGLQLAKLPLDAQLGKLILYGANFGCLDFTLTIAAAMGGKSPFLSPMHAKKQADSVRLGFKRGDSDLLTLYNAYSTWRKVCTTPGLSEHTWCNKSFLSAQNLANIEDLKAQLLTALVDAGFVKLGVDERTALTKIKPGSRRRNFVSLPSTYTRADDSDIIATSVVAWAFYPKIVKQEGKGWRNIANNQSLGLHPTSVNKTSLSPQVKYLSFYSIMQSASRFTNAQETSPVSDFALVLLAGEAVFHMYPGVIVIDGNRVRFKVRDWRTMIVLKTLRLKLREVMAKLLKHPGRELGDRHRKWMEVIERIFEFRQNKTT